MQRLRTYQTGMAKYVTQSQACDQMFYVELDSLRSIPNIPAPLQTLAIFHVEIVVFETLALDK